MHAHTHIHFWCANTTTSFHRERPIDDKDKKAEGEDEPSSAAEKYMSEYMTEQATELRDLMMANGGFQVRSGLGHREQVCACDSRCLACINVYHLHRRAFRHRSA